MIHIPCLWYLHSTKCIVNSCKFNYFNQSSILSENKTSKFECGTLKFLRSCSDSIHLPYAIHHPGLWWLTRWGPRFLVHCTRGGVRPLHAPSIASGARRLFLGPTTSLAGNWCNHGTMYDNHIHPNISWNFLSEQEKRKDETWSDWVEKDPFSLVQATVAQSIVGPGSVPQVLRNEILSQQFNMATPNAVHVHIRRYDPPALNAWCCSTAVASWRSFSERGYVWMWNELSTSVYIKAVRLGRHQCSWPLSTCFDTRYLPMAWSRFKLLSVLKICGFETYNCIKCHSTSSPDSAISTTHIVYTMTMLQVIGHWYLIIYPNSVRKKWGLRLSMEMSWICEPIRLTMEMVTLDAPKSKYLKQFLGNEYSRPAWLGAGGLFEMLKNKFSHITTGFCVKCIQMCFQIYSCHMSKNVFCQPVLICI